jgi:hypothetical protein
MFKALHGYHSIVPEFITLVKKKIHLDIGEFKEDCGALSVFIR